MSPVRDPGAAELEKMQGHVDHEMSRVLRIGDILRCWHCVLPDTVLRAFRVAYAGHTRALLAFFYDGRPGKQGQREGRDSDVDVWFSDYVVGAVPGRRVWDPSDKARLYDADKLLGHLSTGRLDPDRGKRPNWGDLPDRKRFREIIEEIMNQVADAERCFPGTGRALREIKRS